MKNSLFVRKGAWVGVLLMACSLFSCKTRYYDYEVNFNHLNRAAYIVDTITMNNPVRIFFWEGDKYFTFLVEKENLDALSKASFKEVLNDPYTLVFSTSFYVFFPESKLNYDLNCKYKSLPDNIAGRHEVSEFESSSVKFVLALVNNNFFHLEDSSVEEMKIPNNQYKSTYIKVVFPICE